MVDHTTNGIGTHEIPTAADVEVTGLEGASRRARFRTAVADLSARSSSDDLVRWMLIPGSILVFLGFVAMVLGWVGAARTAREIEQIPYLISGGVIGLALVLLGGLLLVSTFWVAVLRKLHAEAEARGTQVDDIAALHARIAELEAARPTPAKRASRTTASRN